MDSFILDFYFRIEKELLKSICHKKGTLGLIKLRIIALNLFKSLKPGLLETKSRMKFVIFVVHSGHGFLLQGYQSSWLCFI